MSSHSQIKTFYVKTTKTYHFDVVVFNNSLFDLWGRGCLDNCGTVSIGISNIVDSVSAICVWALDNSKIGVSRFLSGTVDVAVAKGEVLVLILGVVLGGGDTGSSCSHGSNRSCNGSNCGNWGSSNSSNWSDWSSSDSCNWSSITCSCISIWISESSSICGIESISISITAGQSSNGEDDLQFQM